LSSIFQVITQNILPIFVVAGFGFIVRRRMALDTKVLARITLYVLSPCLVFSSLVNSDLTGNDLLHITGFTVTASLLIGGAAFLIGRTIGLGPRERAALLLVSIFANNGNYGITISTLRYGDDGLARAVIYYTVTTALIYTLGILIATSGKADWRHSLRKLAGMPAFYAVLLALFFYWVSLPLPGFLMRGIEITGQGAIPLMILILGMQIADLREVSALRVAVPGVGIRLLLGPLIGFAAAGLFGLEGLNRSVSLLQTAMPTAVINIILATEFDTYPEAVTTTVVLSTLLSPVTVAVMINLLGL
jgi:hypothetical protein